MSFRVRQTLNLTMTVFFYDKRPRPVLGSEPNMHWTVRYRMYHLPGYHYSSLTEAGASWKIVA